MLRTICLIAVVFLTWALAPEAKAHEGHHHAAQTQQIESPTAIDGALDAALPDGRAAHACALGCCAGIACASCCAVIAGASEFALRPLTVYAVAAPEPRHLGRGLPPDTPPPRTLH
jgi:hypothetical protein